jgi:hypothetical protein
MTHAIPPGLKRCPVCGELTDTAHAKCITPETKSPASPTRPALRLPTGWSRVSDGRGVSFVPEDRPRRK